MWDGFPVSDTVPFISDISDKNYQSISPKIAAEISLSVTRSAWSTGAEAVRSHGNTQKCGDFQTRVSTTGKYVPMMAAKYLASQSWLALEKSSISQAVQPLLRMAK